MIGQKPGENVASGQIGQLVDILEPIAGGSDLQQLSSRAVMFMRMYPGLPFDWMYQPIPNFAMWEIACRCCGLIILQPKLLLIQHEVRQEFGEPIRTHSWCRCPQHNAEVGGKEDSYHVVGKGIDQSPLYGNPTPRFTTICRKHYPIVLVYNTFLHCDTRGSRTLQPCNKP